MFRRLLGTILLCVMLVNINNISVLADEADVENEVTDLSDFEEEIILSGGSSDSSKVANSRVVDGKRIWDCVYFGSYWQSDTNKDGYANKSDEKEPIKWRVLSVDGTDAFLMAEKVLDCQLYNNVYASSMTWEKCTLRSWLNGYGSSMNTSKVDYSGSGKSFISNAFSGAEQAAIISYTVKNNKKNTDNIDGGNDTEDNIYILSFDEATNTEYGFLNTPLQAGGRTYVDIGRRVENTAYLANKANPGWYWLRTPGYTANYAMCVQGGAIETMIAINQPYVGVCPVLHLDLSSSCWSYAGMVDEYGNVIEAKAEGNPDKYKISNPRVDDGNTTWDLVEFGSYWNGTGGKDPLKWRVLAVDDEKIFVVTDKGIDTKFFQEQEATSEPDWNSCTLRSWINGYDGSYNSVNKDYSSSGNSFKSVAFNNDEYKAILTSNIEDKIFLLSDGEVVNSDYGFINQKSRYAEPTDYSLANGALTANMDGKQIAVWWLRTKGFNNNCEKAVDTYGDVYHYGYHMNNYSGVMVRPAIYLDINSDTWKYAGTVSTEANGTSGETGEPENLKVTAVINGKGYAQKTITLKDNDGNLLKNTYIEYSFKNDAGEYVGEPRQVRSDENGKVTIKTKIYDNTASVKATPIKEKLTANISYTVDGYAYKNLNVRPQFDITVNPISFSETWSLRDDKSLEVGAGVGVESKNGAINIEAKVAEISVKGTAGNTLSVKNEYSEGARWLELGQEYAKNLGVNGFLGLKAEASIEGANIGAEGTLGGVSGGVALGHQSYSGLKIKDYDPDNKPEQFVQMGGFVLGTTAVATGNVMAAGLFNVLNEKYDHAFTNTYKNMTNAGIQGGVDVGKVNVSLGETEIASGSVMELNGQSRYSYGQRIDKYDNPSMKPIYCMEKESYGSVAFGAGKTNPIGVNGALWDEDGYTNTYSLESSDDTFTIKSYKNHGTTNAGLTTVRIDDKISFKGDKRNDILSKVNVYNKFANGKSALFLDSAFKEGVENWMNLGVEADYSETYEKSDSVTTGDIGFDVGGGMGVTADIVASVSFTGTYTEGFELESGTFSNGYTDITAVTDIGGAQDVTNIVDPATSVKLGKDGAVELLIEAASAIAEDIKDYVVEKVESAVETVKQGYCTVKCIAKNAKERFIGIFKIKAPGSGGRGSDSVDELISYEIMVYESSDTTGENILGQAGDKLLGTASTIGEAYYIAMYELDGETVVYDFSDTPLEVSLEYTDEMLEAANVSSEKESDIEIFMYSKDDCGYISVGGTVDTTNNTVTVSNITKAGQYILAVNGKESGDEDEPAEELDVPTWLDKVTKVSDTEYVLNLATKEKYSIPELKKVKTDGKNYKISYQKEGRKSESQYASLSSAGIIAAKKAGVSHITLKKNGVDIKITVNVFNPQFKYVSSKQKFFTVNAGEKITPEYESYNIKPVFSLDKNAIKKGLATINAETGEVTPLKYGSVKVTATIGGEQNTKYARKVTTTVKIYEPYIYAGKNSSVKVGKTLKATVKKGYKPATDWKSSNSSIATVDARGRIKGISEGTVKISCVNNGKLISKDITVIK